MCAGQAERHIAASVNGAIVGRTREICQPEYTNLVAQQLDAADRLEDVQQAVKVAARRLADAEGATFVLLDGDSCYYADEDSMSPLWKGQRFPASACISGRAMMHRTAVAISDIRRDERIPQEAYRPTFVRSLVMAPILGPDLLGAIGVYWSRPGRPSPSVVEALERLAKLAADALQRFPNGLPDPGFKPAWATRWRDRLFNCQGVD